MEVCGVWLARDFLRRADRPLDIPPCAHSTDDCPPITPKEHDMAPDQYRTHQINLLASRAIDTAMAYGHAERNGGAGEDGYEAIARERLDKLTAIINELRDLALTDTAAQERMTEQAYELSQVHEDSVRSSGRIAWLYRNSTRMTQMRYNAMTTAGYDFAGYTTPTDQPVDQAELLTHVRQEIADLEREAALIDAARPQVCTPPMGIANESPCLLAPMHAGLREPPVPTHPNAEGADAEMDRNGPAFSTPTWRLEGTREISDAEREAFTRVEHMLQPIDPNRLPVHIRDLTQPAASCDTVCRCHHDDIDW